MEIKLIHPFLKKAHNLTELLNGVNKLSTFCTKLEKQSILFPDRYDPMKYRGDGTELFSEALIKLSPVNTHIGITDYAPIWINDVGVDGKGKSMIDGLPFTVQIKYRGDQSLLLKTGDLRNFEGVSRRQTELGGFGVTDLSSKHMLIITTASGLHYFTENEMFGNCMLVLGYEQLRRLVDNNLAFWNAFRQLVNESNNSN